MRRAAPLSILGLLLAACQPTVPDSGGGVGFGAYDRYQRDQAAQARDAQLAGAGGAPEQTGAPTAGELAAAGIGGGAAGAPLDGTGGRMAGGQADAVSPVQAPNNPGISDEQDFEAVSERRSIESDAERLARLRAARVQIAPQSVPERPRGSGSNIVAFALGTTNVPGEVIYNRVLGSERRAQAACARFTSPDLAQEAFLDAGGPQRDRRGLDPDGDGFACEWDPRPFRRGVAGAVVPDQVEPEQ